MGAQTFLGPKEPDRLAGNTSQEALVPADEPMIDLLERSRDCVKILGLEGTLDFITCGGMDAFSTRDFAPVQGKLWWSLWPEHTQDLVKQAFERARKGYDVEFTAECPTVQGNLRKWVVRLKPMTSDAGSIVGVLCTSADIDSAINRD